MIELKGDLFLKNKELTLFNNLGNKIIETKFNGHSHELDINKLTQGVYYLKIKIGPQLLMQKILILK
jgi:hypothetical protein